MKGSSQRFRRAFFWSATAVATAAVTAAAVTTSAAGAQPKPHAGPSQIGPGYPPPGGIYSLFTNCPLLNPVMAESPSVNDPMYQGVSYAACVAGDASSGTLKIGNITTPVVRPVNVQFGFSAAEFRSRRRQHRRRSLAAARGPAAARRAVRDAGHQAGLDSGEPAHGTGVPWHCPRRQESLREAENFGGKYLDVYGLAHPRANSPTSGCSAGRSG